MSSVSVITGITSIAANIRGSTSMVIGSSPIVFRASSSSFTFMVPISAANADPGPAREDHRRQQRPELAHQADRHQVGNEDIGTEAPHRHRRLKRQDHPDQKPQHHQQWQRAQPGGVDIPQQVRQPQHAMPRGQPDHCHRCLADEANTGGEQPEHRAGEVRQCPSGSGRRRAAMSQAAGGAGAAQQSHCALVTADELRSLAVRRLDGSQETRPTDITERHLAQIEHQPAAARLLSRADRRTPQRTDRFSIKPTSEGRARHFHPVAGLTGGQPPSMRQPALETRSQLGEVVVPETGIDPDRGGEVGRQGR